MPDLDLTAAVVAAQHGIGDRLFWSSLHWNTGAVDPEAWPHIAYAAVAAAAPVIEAQVRELVAREIEAMADRRDYAPLKFMCGEPQSRHEGLLKGLDLAAAIARGGARWP